MGTEGHSSTQKALRAVQAFSELDATSLAEIEQIAEQLEVARGEVLIHQRDTADTFYIVLKGRFVVLANDTPIAEVSVGEPIGELAFFTGGTRSASVVAARNSAVLALSRSAYDTLAQRLPALSNGILAALSHRLAKTVSATPKLHPRAGQVCCVMPAADAPIPPGFVRQLRAAFQGIDGWAILEAADCPPNMIADKAALTKWAEDQEAKVGNLVLVCRDPKADAAWKEIASNQSDTIMFVGAAAEAKDGEVPVSPLEAEMMRRTMPSNTQLVICRETATDSTLHTDRWLTGRDLAMHHHIAMDRPADFQRLGRFIRGQALGLVLCGGGAFGTAHLGALKALQENGYAFDYVGGTSVGAAMAGALAIELDPDEVMRRCMDIFIGSKAMSRLTVPIHSVLEHHRLDEALARHYGALNIEDAPLNYFAIATNLSDNNIRVMRRGKLWQAVRASGSLPGLFPPLVTDDGEVLVDGGLLDNAPVKEMRDLKPGPNVVLNFPVGNAWRVDPTYEMLPRRKMALLRLFNPFKRKFRFPTVFSVLSRTMVVNSRNLLANTDFGADILVNVAIQKRVSFVDWTKGQTLFDNAYAQMNAALSQIPDTGDDDTARLARLRAAAQIVNAGA